MRGANDYMLDEMERSIHDSLSIVKRTLESNMVVAGGGAVEAALSVYLENLATTLGSREQLAVVEFALALLVIPKVILAHLSQLSIWICSFVSKLYMSCYLWGDCWSIICFLEDHLCNVMSFRRNAVVKCLFVLAVSCINWQGILVQCILEWYLLMTRHTMHGYNWDDWNRCWQ